IRAEEAEPQIEELSPARAREVFDAAARHYLGMSGDEFLAAWRAGDFKDEDRTAVLAVVMLLPLVEEPVAG
ncbi:MAG: hypothetical protein ACRDKJ_06235, partial [Actinomycetota bacterium]